MWEHATAVLSYQCSDWQIPGETAQQPEWCTVLMCDTAISINIYCDKHLVDVVIRCANGRIIMRRKDSVFYFWQHFARVLAASAGLPLNTLQASSWQWASEHIYCECTHNTCFSPKIFLLLLFGCRSTLSGQFVFFLFGMTRSEEREEWRRLVVTSCGAPTVHKIMGQIDR